MKKEEKKPFLLSDNWARAERSLNIVAAVGTMIALWEPMRDMYYKYVLKKAPPKSMFS